MSSTTQNTLAARHTSFLFAAVGELLGDSYPRLSYGIKALGATEIARGAFSKGTTDPWIQTGASTVQFVSGLLTGRAIEYLVARKADGSNLQTAVALVSLVAAPLLDIKIASVRDNFVEKTPSISQTLSSAVSDAGNSEPVTEPKEVKRTSVGKFL
jgi:hypothetical protein